MPQLRNQICLEFNAWFLELHFPFEPQSEVNERVLHGVPHPGYQERGEEDEQEPEPPAWSGGCAQRLAGEHMASGS